MREQIFYEPSNRDYFLDHRNVGDSWYLFFYARDTLPGDVHALLTSFPPLTSALRNKAQVVTLFCLHTMYMLGRKGIVLKYA